MFIPDGSSGHSVLDLTYLYSITDSNFKAQFASNGLASLLLPDSFRLNFYGGW